MLDSTDPAAVRRRRDAPDAHAVSARQQVGHDHRAELARRPFSPAPAGGRQSRAGPIISSPSPTKAPSSPPRARRTLPRSVHQPVGHRRPLLRAVVLRHGAGGADGTGHRGDHRLVAGDARGAPSRASPTRARTLRSRSACAMGAAAHDGRDKLTLIAPSALDAFGLWVEQLIAESTGKKRHRHRADRRRAARRSPTSTAPIGCSSACACHGASGEDDARRRHARCKPTGAPVVDDRPAGTARARRRVRAMGDRHRRRGRDARHQPVRRAERAAGEGRDATGCSTNSSRTDGCRSRRPTARSDGWR